GSHVVHHPVGAHARDATEFHQYNLASRTEGLEDRMHGSVRKLEVMIGVADKGEVNGVGGQFGGGRRADHAYDLLEILLVTRLDDVIDELFRDVHGVDLAFRADERREKTRKQTGAGSDIDNHHATFDLRG